MNQTRLFILFLFLTTMSLAACSKGGILTTEQNEENTITTDSQQNSTNDDNMENKKIKLAIGNHILTATLADNSSVDSLVQVLKTKNIVVDMDDYGNMEKVGSLGQPFPRNDTSITTEAGDIILYQGNMLVIYYAPNSWSFTRLGKIDNITGTELKSILGKGGVTVTLSLVEE